MPTGHKHKTRAIPDEAYRLLILKELGELCDMLSEYAQEKGTIGTTARFKMKAETFRGLMRCGK